MTPLIYVRSWQRTIAPPFGHHEVKQGEVEEGDLILGRDLCGPQWFGTTEKLIGKPVQRFPLVVRKEPKA